MANATEQRKKITEDTMRKLEEAMNAIYDDVTYTGDNVTTLTFEAGEVDGKTVYGSIKFTLHKSNWDLNKEMEKYFDKVEEMELKAREAAQKKAEKERKLAAQKAKAEARQAQEDREMNKRKKSIAELKAKLGESAED